MEIKLYPESMISKIIITYFVLLGLTLFFIWPEEWTDPTSYELIIFSLGVFVGATLTHILYWLDLDDKQEEVDNFLALTQTEFDSKKSELNLHIKHVKDREDFLLEAIDRLNTESSNEIQESEPEEEPEELQETEEKHEEVQELEEEIDYKSMTVTQIKKILKEKGLSTSGKKKDLVSRLVK